MQQPLVALGLHPRQLLLLEPAAAPPRGWSLGGALSAAASWLNPYSYITGPAGTPSDGSGHAAAGGGSGSGGQQGRPGGGTAGGGGGANIHTLHGSSSGSGGGAGQQGGDPDGNSYWNGNSTEFGAGPPPGQQ